jgi:glycosyltransferase involved in cell wall biosynthesis
VRVLAKLEPGGAQLSVLRLCRALRDRGIATELLVGEATREGLALARDHGVDAVAMHRRLVGLQWTPSPAFAAWLAPRLAGADLVHAHMFGAWWAAAQAAAPDVVLVASEHNTLAWPERPHHRALAAALPRVDHVFAHGPAARAYLRALGARVDRLAPGRSAIAGTDATPRPGLRTPRIVFTGRLEHDKGPDVLVEALPLLPPRVAAYLVGAGSLRGALEARVAALGEADRVRFPGWQAAPGRWVAGAAAYAAPSREEAWSQSVVLAMALGTPVVAARVEALPEVLAAGRGVLVDPEDPEALATGLRGVLDGRLRPDLAAARAYAAGFRPALVAAGYLEAYTRLLAARRAPATAAAAAAAVIA